ncbi:sulfatase-like hydrolase/transferase [Staphylococcus epidermidis]|nr:sulfatase-like hydrolase/transferase [Staphylococcus epidermidis]
MTDPRPNLIFILADDLGYADLAAPAHAMRTTTPPMSPRLDAMAAQGLRFTRGYSNSPCRPRACAGHGPLGTVCAARPSRLPACMATKYWACRPSNPTVASLLRDAGYATALIGKWHLGYPPHFGPRQSGYEEFYGFHAGGNDYFAHCDPRGRPDFWLNEEPHEEDGYRPIC